MLAGQTIKLEMDANFPPTGPEGLVRLISWPAYHDQKNIKHEKSDSHVIE